jgi:sterol desaturase/sphingolipid hydroxylase (fatty acid hydroxylase superfamily)
LWKFHAIHHHSKDLDWLSAVRLHPVNDWLTRWAQVTALVVLGFSPTAVAAYVPFLTFYAVFLHANVSWGFGPLGRFVASPKFHRWHHTSEDEGLDKNFAGLLPLFDVIFGTYYMPKGRLPRAFGVKNEEIPESFWQQLAYPFRPGRPRPSRRNAELVRQRARAIDLRERLANRSRVEGDGAVLRCVEPVRARDRMDVAIED